MILLSLRKHRSDQSSAHSKENNKKSNAVEFCTALPCFGCSLHKALFTSFSFISSTLKKSAGLNGTSVVSCSEDYLFTPLLVNRRI